MGRKIFVTYKYSDPYVQNLQGIYFTTVRHYVDELQNLLDVDDHIYKGENDGESLEDFRDETIATKLKDKIFDSSLTIVMISKGMKEINKSENDQWIPWEVSYSLKELSREGKISKMNAILAVVLPDEYGSYEYFLTYNPYCNSTTYNINRLFKILKENMFNIKKPVMRECQGIRIYEDYFSYIYSVRWDLFKGDINKYIEIAFKIKDNMKDYNISKMVT